MPEILIVDGSLTVRMDLKEALEQAGFSTAVCASAAAARRELSAGDFELIVLDPLLPGGDGVDLLKELRAEPRTAGLPVIVLADRSDMKNLLQGLHSEPDEYLGKPYDRDRLVNRARELALHEPAQKSGLLAPTGKGLFEPRRILAVDDSPTYLHELADRLGQQGTEVLLARSGEEALDLLPRHAIDCILLDLVMPGLSGEETCRRIKSTPQWRNIPILMLTGREDREAIVESFNAGADDYISKSSELAVLRARMRAQVRRKRYEEENRRIREQLHASEIEAAEARLNREARKLARQWQTTFDAIGDAIALLDSGGAVIRVNRALARLLRQEPDSIAGASLLELLDPAARDQIRPVLVSSGPKRERRPLELPLWGGWYSFTLDPVSQTDGVVSGAVCIFSDVGERRRTEEELKTAKSAAEAANAAKDRFLAVLSHELRTPLTPVLMMASSMESDESLPGNVRDDAGMIRRSVELEVRLIDDLLDISRIIHGKLSLRRELRDIHKKLRHAVDMCRLDAADKRLHLEAQFNAECSVMECDGSRLQQVFWNLIKNAIKFTPPDGRVCVHTYNPGPDLLRVEVADTGIGIGPEKLSTVFDAFEQESDAVTREFGGLGLGLAISKALVEMHGGRIRADSPGPGQGSTFTVDLPLVGKLAGQSPPDRPTEAGCGRKVRILLVEDHAATAQITAKLLRKFGHEVEVATDVRSAVEIGRSAPFDILLSDLGLPDGSGLDVMRTLREHAPNVVGIALTGLGMPEDINRSREAGFAEHLTKPIDFESLRAVITRVTQTVNPALQDT
jgi:PAS domain S-box-containing protein